MYDDLLGYVQNSYAQGKDANTIRLELQKAGIYKLGDIATAVFYEMLKSFKKI